MRDERAMAILDELSDEAVTELAAAWQVAVERQDREIEDAIDGSLSLLPRLVRTRVMKILTGGPR